MVHIQKRHTQCRWGCCIRNSFTSYERKGLLEKANLQNKSKRHKFINAEKCASFFHDIPFHFSRMNFSNSNRFGEFQFKMISTF